MHVGILPAGGRRSPGGRRRAACRVAKPSCASRRNPRARPGGTAAGLSLLYTTVRAVVGGLAGLWARARANSANSTARPPGAYGEWDGWGGSTTCICSLSFAPCISCQKSEVSEMHPSLFTFYAVSAAQTAGHRPSTSYHAFQDSLQCRLVEDRYLIITNRYVYQLV